MTRRMLLHAAILTLVASVRLSASGCELYQITGYVRTDFAGPTADGTPIRTDEPIVAASYNLPLGSYVWIEDLGTFRVADRGMLGPRHLDVATWTRSEAYQLTGWRMACPL